jgi:2-aminoadipate transaminase
VPSADLLPVDDLREAAAKALRDEPALALSYGGGAGHPGLRAWIAERHAVAVEEVVCTNGSLEAFALVADLLLAGSASRRVLVEAPTYDRSILILQRLGAEVVGVTVDEDGIDVDALERSLSDGVPAFVYVIPNFQNPSGATLSAGRRTRLVELAGRHGFTIVEDDPYGLLRWRGESLPSLLSLARRAGVAVVSLSSFTKTVAPGLRVGYALSSPEHAAALTRRANDTYISPGMLAEATLAAYCAAGRFEPGVARARAALAARCGAMAAAVRAHFPSGARFVEPSGGYFLWVDLPDAYDTSALLAPATAEGVPYVRGADFYADDGGGHSLRLAFSAVSEDAIGEGIARLGGVLAAVPVRA